VDWSPLDNRLILSVDQKGSICIWNIVTHTCGEIQLEDIQPVCIKASPYEKDVVAVGTAEGSVMIVLLPGKFCLMECKLD